MAPDAGYEYFERAATETLLRMRRPGGRDELLLVLPRDAGCCGGHGAPLRPRSEYDDDAAARDRSSDLSDLVVQDFYSAHGADATLVAAQVFRTHSVLRYLGAGGKASGLPSVTLGRAAARDFLRDALTARQLRIEIYAGGGKRSNVWNLVKQVSCMAWYDPPACVFRTSLTLLV